MLFSVFSGSSVHAAAAAGLGHCLHPLFCGYLHFGYFKSPIHDTSLACKTEENRLQTEEGAQGCCYA